MKLLIFLYIMVSQCEGVIHHGKAQAKDDSSLGFATTEDIACRDEEVCHDEGKVSLQ